ncbi:hypothetical protein O9K51_03225 [Purpureocillium lavendulum]|uniref:Uncharacterized protein n=1 Tax=Purpureocillium lavendulum TaxID=1247861 RepID=A0AB34G3J3_9HYPO|nr:hypothetical protein O9K51_03225 [Purpureocillium lavendulum]
MHLTQVALCVTGLLGSLALAEPAEAATSKAVVPTAIHSQPAKVHTSKSKHSHHHHKTHSGPVATATAKPHGKKHKSRPTSKSHGHHHRPTGSTRAAQPTKAVHARDEVDEDIDEEIDDGVDQHGDKKKHGHGHKHHRPTGVKSHGGHHHHRPTGTHAAPAPTKAIEARDEVDEEADDVIEDEVDQHGDKKHGHGKHGHGEHGHEHGHKHQRPTGVKSHGGHHHATGTHAAPVPTKVIQARDEVEEEIDDEVEKHDEKKHGHGEHGHGHGHGNKHQRPTGVKSHGGHHHHATGTHAAPVPTKAIQARDEVEEQMDDEVDAHHPGHKGKPTGVKTLKGHYKHPHPTKAPVHTTLKKVARPPVMTYMPIKADEALERRDADEVDGLGPKPTDGPQVQPSLTRPGSKNPKPTAHHKHPKATTQPKHPKNKHGKHPHHPKPSPSAAPVKPV